MVIGQGQIAPGFELAGDDGKTLKLASLRGGPVVLYFYPKDDTSGCTLEAQDFTALADDFAALGATIVGISPDSVKDHCKFRDKYALKLRLLADEGHAVAEAYGLWVEKSMYGRKYMGVERTTLLLDAKGRVARLWRKVKVPGHAAEVLAALREHVATRPPSAGK